MSFSAYTIYQIVFASLFYIFQIAGILTTSIAFSQNNKEITWVGISFLILATVLYMAGRINELVFKIKRDIDEGTNDYDMIIKLLLTAWIPKVPLPKEKEKETETAIPETH